MNFINMNYLLLFLCVGVGGIVKSQKPIPENRVDGCDSLRQTSPFASFTWFCIPSYQCNVKINLRHVFGTNDITCGPSSLSQICCPTLNPSENRLLYPYSQISPTPATTRMSTIVFDSTCSSLSEKYEHFPFSCDYPQNAPNCSKLLKLYFIEKVGCDHSNEAKICCPSDEWFKKATTPLTPTTPRRDMDIDCKKIREKHEKPNTANRFKWSCKQEAYCNNQRFFGVSNQKMQCDEADLSKICCPEDIDHFATTVLPSSIWSHSESEETSTFSGIRTSSLPPRRSPTLRPNVGPAPRPGASNGAGDSKQPPRNKDATQDDTRATTSVYKPVVLHSTNSVFDEYEELKKKKYGQFDRELLSVLTNGTRSENIVVSPLSIKLLLAVIMEGSAGDTANEILRTLKLSPNKQESSILLRKLQALYSEKNPNITLITRSKIYKAPGVDIVRSYEEKVNSFYSTDIEPLNFKNPDAASKVINAWVNEVTHGLIPSLVDKDNIQESMKLFLVNYIFLKASWDTEFNRQLTHKGCFHNLQNPNDCQHVMFMNKRRVLKYKDSQDLNAQIIELPFKDLRCSAVFVLPNEKGKVYELLAEMHDKDLFDIFNHLEPTAVNLTIPRTTIDYSTDLIQTLQQLHIKELFTPSANLREMLINTSQVGVSNVIHKARIEINEEGTKAAGVSGSGVQVLSLNFDKHVVFDHPFLFFIRDNRVAGFLFEGIVVSPDGAEVTGENKF